MKNFLKRSLAVWIVFCLLLTMPCVSTLASETDLAENTDWLQRYTDHMKGESSISKYGVTEYYLHSMYADTLDEIKEDHWSAKFFLWATHQLTKIKFDEEAYVEVLAEILAMLEKGMPDTAAIQAQYAEQTALGVRVVEFTKVTVEELLTSELAGTLMVGGKPSTFINELSDAMSLLKDSVDIEQFLEQTIQSAGEAAILAHSCQLYQKKKIFLNAIIENTDNKKLKQAAESLMQGAELTFLGVIVQNLGQFGANQMEIAWDLDEIYDLNLTTELTEKAMSKANQWLEALGKSGLSAKTSKYVLTGVQKAATFASLFQTGTTIGGAFGNFLHGDQLERYREMLILAEIGDALVPAISDSNYRETNAADIEGKYSNVVRYVTCGEALCYARMRGEACYLASIDKNTAREEKAKVENYIDGSTKRLYKVYDSLAAIFPGENAGVVTVQADIERYEDQSSKVLLTVPKITIAGNLTATENIMNHEWFEEQNTEMQSNKQQVMNGTEEGFTYYYMVDAYNSGNVLSLVYCSRTHYPGARGVLMFLPTVNFDISSGEQIEWRDLAMEEENISDLQNLMIEYLGTADEVFLQGMFASPEDTILGLDDRSYGRQEGVHWAFTSEGMSLFFAVGMIAMPMAGNLRIDIPYERLRGIVKEEYLPAETDSAANSPSLKVEGDKKEGYVLCNEGDKIRNLKVLDVTNDYAFESALLYYSSEMQKDETVDLPTEGIGYPGGERSGIIYEIFQDALYVEQVMIS